MMRIIVVISLLCLTLACARKEAGKSTINLSGRNTSPDSEIIPGEETETFFDSTFYIGYVDYFPETQEFYTALFYKEGYEYPDEDLLESKLDSVIIYDDDWGRERLPMKEARKMLILSGLDTILIYNRRNDLIARASLTRVEYLWNGLESYFIGVFKSDVKFTEQTEELYGISSNYDGIGRRSFSCEEIVDEGLDRRLVKNLHIDPEMNWEMRHYRIQPGNATYSIISVYAMDSDEKESYLTAVEGNEVTVLNHQANDYEFLNILPLPLAVNNKPLLLVTSGYPSSDLIWDYLAAFNGTRYEAVEYNRIHQDTMLLKH